MNSLEAFERAGALPEGSLRCVPALKPPVFPIKVDPDLPSYWQDFTRASIFFLDDDLVLKLQTQYPVGQVNLPQEDMLVLISLAGFSAADLAEDTRLRMRGVPPCPNLVAEFDMEREGVGFSERLTPVTEVWADATKERRRRWAVEMTSAVAYLETIGLVPSHIDVRDLGIDKAGRLKLIGFATSDRKPSETAEDDDGKELDESLPLSPGRIYRRAMEGAHQRLACCLYYLLSGADVDSEIRSLTSVEEIRAFREKVRGGNYQLDQEAAAVSEVIQAAWMKRAGTVSFAQTAEDVRAALESLGIEVESELPPALSQGHYQALEARCREWADAQVLDPDWMGLDEFEAACEQAGF
ncbi:putative kinase [Staphylotrichum tortipilum]|uniref:Kinase n=1 Tax=Staphylotrichum tortipilum TaxID=2831512 RepID=A0AAN6RSR5_9PEZI|nr:putative kinase [Staphylotrichum longicolle]